MKIEEEKKQASRYHSFHFNVCLDCGLSAFEATSDVCKGALHLPEEEGEKERRISKIPPQNLLTGRRRDSRIQRVREREEQEAREKRDRVTGLNSLFMSSILTTPKSSYGDYGYS